MNILEPTTGLDCALSNEVMSAIKNLSMQNRTVIFAIHQPSPDSFELFDMLILLTVGKLIYIGPCSNAVQYFTQSPFKFDYKAGVNPAEFVVAVAGSFVKSSEGKYVSGEELRDYFKSQNESVNSELKNGVSFPISKEKIEFPNSFYVQVMILFSRYGTVYFRNINSILIVVVRFDIFFAYLFCILDPSSYLFSSEQSVSRKI